MCDNGADMKNINVQISEEEFQEVTHAYQILQNFLEKIISPNELYTDEFVSGLNEARAELENKEFVKVKDFADFTQ